MARIMCTLTSLFLILITSAGCADRSNCLSTAPETTNTDENIDSWQLDMAWCLSGLTLSPPEPVAGQAVEFGVWLMVPDIVERMGTWFLVINGKVASKGNVYIDADCTERLNETYIFAEPGNYEVKFNVLLGENACYQPGGHEQIINITVGK